MGVGTFEVAEYQVRVVPRILVSTAAITLHSVDYSHGINHDATLTFYPAESAGASYGTVYNVGGLNYNGHTLYVRAVAEHYDRCLHLLQTEKPVYLHYYYTDGDPADTSKDLYWVTLNTSREPVGEEEANQSS